MLEKSDYQKDNSVELDTDGVEEQSVQVEESNIEEKETDLPKEEVDLGYTEPKAAGIENISVEETEDTNTKKVDDLTSVSESVKKRINKSKIKSKIYNMNYQNCILRTNR